MICKYYLMVGSDKVDINSQSCIDVSSMIANLKDIKLSYNRVDYGGVTRKCGSNIEFVGNARDVLIEHYTVNGLGSTASFAVYGIENDWTYTEIFSCPLDFSTFTYDSYKVEIGCLDNSIAALIKANKTTKYEYPVSDIKEKLQLAYDRVSIRNEVIIQAIGNREYNNEDTITDIDKSVWWFYPRVGIISSETPSNESILFQDSPETFQTDGTPMIWGMPALNKTDAYFIECLKDCVVSVDFTDIGLWENLQGCVLAKISGGSVTPLNCGYSNVMSKDGNTYPSALRWSGELKKGERLQFAIYNYYHGSMDSGVTFEAHKNGYIAWNDRQESLYFDIVSPHVLLSKLVTSMCPGTDVRVKIKSTINGIENVRLNQLALCPAECIRQFASAKIYSSFDEFCKWMETTFGYIYQIEDMSESDEELILSNIYDFTCIYHDGYVNKLDDIVFRDTKFGSGDKLGYFFKVISEMNLESSFDYGFPGYEDYQSMEWGNEPSGVKVRTDRLYRSINDMIVYSAVNKIKKGNYWYSELSEAVVEEVSASSYADTVEFGSIVSEEVTESETYSGQVAVSRICYCRKNRKFLYLNNGSYYRYFSGQNQYNNGDVARNDMMYVSNGQHYIILKECLVKCTVTENEDTVKYPTVIFKHKSEVFDKTSVLYLTNVSDCVYKLATDRLYSKVAIGYNKQDYDLGNNGKDEFNFKSVYTTGVTLDDKELNMVSPYRADSYGVEELTGKIGEDTSSTESDSQVFAISCVKSGNEYVVLRESKIEGVSTDSMFNAALSPIKMIEANKSYLASFSDKLTFVSSEGNSSVLIDGKSIAEDITLSEPLFGHGNISFTTDELVLPEDWNGCVEIPWNGVKKKGFLSTLDINVANNEAYEYELIEVIE
ncbi:hypothetical protein [uncultured Bacteroides sp.]|uniref:hypothetical protein n=1 Tax=uncultured Bacteroides sp. TaxID=162156 RepID=UPI00263A1CED|nr:hypothetical protein [uncultured Bacteroides sp.]